MERSTRTAKLSECRSVHVRPRHVEQDVKAMPARKRSKFKTKCLEISAELQIQCDGSHEHQRPLGGRTKHAQRHLKGLYRAVCVGLAKAIWNQPMRLMQLVKVDRRISVHDENNKSDHFVEDKSRITSLGKIWTQPS